MSALSIRYGSPTTLPLDVLLSMIPSLPRAALSRLTERAIDRMDELDGDTDLEDDDPAECEARDDGCGSINLRGVTMWGSDAEADW